MKARNNIQIEKAQEVLTQLAVLFPDAHCELVHDNPFQLTVAVILSAQATDVSVNKVTPQLFAMYPSAKEMSRASIEEIEVCIKSIGLYHNKAKSLHGLSLALMESFQGEVPADFETLITLPGVGRKSANVIRSVCFHQEAFAVDTHVERIAKRLGFAKKDDNVLEVEKKMCRAIPSAQWEDAHHRMIFFGRYLCKAMKPDCIRCPFPQYCSYAAEQVKLKTAKKKTV